MTDARADQPGDEDRLPWLEAVEEDEDQGGPPVAKLIGAILIGLIAIAVIVGGLFWLGNRNRTDGNGEIIAAPDGEYKVRPEEPGGMNVTGEGGTAAAASAGAEPKGQINTNAVAEAPIARPQAPATRPQAPAARPQVPAPARPQPAATGPGATIQLGAFSTSAGANNAWRALSARFRYLAPLGHSVVPVQSGGRTLYRLRASGPDAANVCRRLQVAGEDCAVVG
jgi:hypothetical protein